MIPAEPSQVPDCFGLLGTAQTDTTASVFSFWGWGGVFDCLFGFVVCFVFKRQLLCSQIKDFSLEDKSVVHSLDIFTIPMYNQRYNLCSKFWSGYSSCLRSISEQKTAWLRLYCRERGSKTWIYKTSECREQPVLKGLTCQQDSSLLLIRKDLSSFLHCACWIWSMGRGRNTCCV